jgi:uncharacterized protein YdaU (DUF1376 family)
MASRPWFPLYVADYLADTQALTMAENGAYLHLLMYQWNYGAIPDDERTLARLCRMDVRPFRKIWATISRYFSQKSPGLLFNKRLDKEREKAGDISGKRATSALQMHSNRRANAQILHPGLQTHPQSQSDPQLQDPDPGGSSHTNRARAPAPDGADGWPEDAAEQFWSAYPNKVARTAALAALAAVRAKRVVTWDDLMAGVMAYAAKADDRRWMNPKNWLEGERWNDRPAPMPAQRDGRARAGLADVAASLIAEAEERQRGARDDGGQAGRTRGHPAGDDDGG